MLESKTAETISDSVVQVLGCEDVGFEGAVFRGCEK